MPLSYPELPYAPHFSSAKVILAGGLADLQGSEFPNRRIHTRIGRVQLEGTCLQKPGSIFWLLRDNCQRPGCESTTRTRIIMFCADRDDNEGREYTYAPIVQPLRHRQ